jgi:hypothetical protein
MRVERRQGQGQRAVLSAKHVAGKHKESIGKRRVLSNAHLQTRAAVKDGPWMA